MLPAKVLPPSPTPRHIAHVSRTALDEHREGMTRGSSQRDEWRARLVDSNSSDDERDFSSGYRVGNARGRGVIRRVSLSDLSSTRQPQPMQGHDINHSSRRHEGCEYDSGHKSHMIRDGQDVDEIGEDGRRVGHVISRQGVSGIVSIPLPPQDRLGRPPVYGRGVVDSWEERGRYRSASAPWHYASETGAGRDSDVDAEGASRRTSMVTPISLADTCSSRDSEDEGNGGGREDVCSEDEMSDRSDGGSSVKVEVDRRRFTKPSNRDGSRGRHRTAGEGVDGYKQIDSHGQLRWDKSRSPQVDLKSIQLDC